ncbi:uncharacterized protein LY79DRAFT_576543 [Colletotrichum navitas]|uniref:Uncharacterized protein n=1 Tax=Colletotrichum navitas TaxID=681940 RepID=A0AAD8VAU0_9PEZI|nr:uncharacterized protein LY79DRAFT_576543 [Colletotrichum navitas]KAK1597740.1 hypothetical protein LY79DRAFT_576543 [Colletotrichum navitas]
MYLYYVIPITYVSTTSLYFTVRVEQFHHLFAVTLPPAGSADQGIYRVKDQRPDADEGCYASPQAPTQLPELGLLRGMSPTVRRPRRRLASTLKYSVLGAKCAACPAGSASTALVAGSSPATSLAGSLRLAQRTKDLDDHIVSDSPKHNDSLKRANSHDVQDRKANLGADLVEMCKARMVLTLPVAVPLIRFLVPGAAANHPSWSVRLEMFGGMHTTLHRKTLLLEDNQPLG